MTLYNDIADLHCEMDGYKTVVEELTAERDALQAALTTEREIWTTAASEQGRVIAELRAQLAEFVSAYDAYIDAPIDQSTAWMDAIERLDALRDAIAPNKVDA